MLLINETEMKKAVTYEELMDAIEEAFHRFTNGSYNMPERFVAQDKEDSMLYMPCFVEEFIGTKMLSVFPKNPSMGKPFIDGLMILNDRENGEPMAIMNGRILTALRTGAVGGVAMKYLAHEMSDSVGVIGCGVQGFYQIKYAISVRPIKRVYLYDAMKENLDDFIKLLASEIGDSTIEYFQCEDSRAVVEASDIVITTTGSKEPVMPNDPNLLKGKCFIAIGSWRPDMQEIPEAIWEVVHTVYTELPYACEESGDLLKPLQAGIITKERVGYMGELLETLKDGKIKDLGETRFYKSVGMSIFDCLTAKVIYENAKQKGIGTEISL